MSQQRKVPAYHEVEGIRVCRAFSPEAVSSAIHYKPKAEDFFVATFPKCGTTWTQHIVFLILNKGKPFESIAEFLQRTPFLELTGADAIENMPRPGLMKIHLPFHSAPYSPDAKYIYVSRNPKDTCVSFYHHTKGFALYEFEDGTFDDFFELFINGENDYGDYFENTLSWYEHRNEPNILFLTYEEMKMDTEKVILKIAQFLGKEWKIMLEKNPEIMGNVIKYSSVNHMKNIMNGMHNLKEATDKVEDLPSGLKYLREKLSEIKIENAKPFEFVRKGVIGDWKNHFTEEQAKKLDEKTKDKLEGTEIYEYWKSLGIFE